MTQTLALTQVDSNEYSGVLTYDRWMESIGIPIHRGYYIEDLRTVELGWWTERDSKAAFVQLDGMQGVCETRVTEIAPGQTLPPLKLGVDEAVYVLQGNGLGSVWEAEGAPRQNFEWGPRSLFLIPRHHWAQLGNARGDTPVRLMHFNYLPIAMSGSNSPHFFFNNPYREPAKVAEVYSEATVSRMIGDHDDPYLWMGNFFPDLQAWDKLAEYQHRGAGGHHLQIKFPNTEMTCHMSVFDARTYKKGHRHGPGRAIVIPAGEGYSVMWPEGGERVVIPWHEASLFTPPNRWFHQHFNAGTAPARYLAMHPAPAFRGLLDETVDAGRDQLEYHQEDPWIRQKFAEELAKRSTSSLMPEECYQDPNYKWSFKGTYSAPAT